MFDLPNGFKGKVAKLVFSNITRYRSVISEYIVKPKLCNINPHPVTGASFALIKDSNISFDLSLEMAQRRTQLHQRHLVTLS